MGRVGDGGAKASGGEGVGEREGETGARRNRSAESPTRLK